MSIIHEVAEIEALTRRIEGLATPNAASLLEKEIGVFFASGAGTHEDRERIIKRWRGMMRETAKSCLAKAVKAEVASLRRKLKAMQSASRDRIQELLGTDKK